MILVTGASGHIGRRAAELLAGSGQALRLLVRDNERAPKLPGAETVCGDYAQPEGLDAAFRGISTALVVSVSGEPGKRAELHRNAFEAAARGGVGHVVYLSLEGSSPQSKYPYSRDHYASEQCLAATGLPHTILRNAFYIDMFLHQFDDDGVIRGPAGQGRGAFVSREDVAQTVAALLRSPRGGIHVVTGPEAITVGEVARRLSVLAGRPLRYVDAPAVTRESETWKNELKRGWFEAIAVGELETTTDAVRRFSGRPPLTAEAYFGAFPDLLEPLASAATRRSAQ